MTSWCKPENLASPQGYLFSTKTEVALAGLRVSSDEARRWFEKGWLSFSVDEVLELELPRDEELRFVASLARSGLNDALIDLLLAPLSRPYQYCRNKIAYSFTEGWVAPPELPDPFEIVDQHVYEWLDSLSEAGSIYSLKALHERIKELLEEAGEDTSCEMDR